MDNVVNFEIEIPYQIEAELVADCINSGIEYIDWASEVSIERLPSTPYTDEWGFIDFGLIVTSDGVLRIVEEDDFNRHVHYLDRVKVANGLAHMAALFPLHFQDLMDDNSDAITADVLIQLSLFNEVIYA